MCEQWQTTYCDREIERDNAVKELGGKPEIMWFEDLGEISPKGFAPFIGTEMRSEHSRIRGQPEAVPALNIGRDKNPPDRKDYITERRAMPVEV